MIEMLGVVAVIGVLSAGGIMGYSTAMENYKVNKVIDEIIHINARAISLFNNSVRSGANSANTEELCNIGIISKELCQTLHYLDGVYYPYRVNTALDNTTLFVNVFNRSAGVNFNMSFSGKTVVVKGPSFGIHPELYGISDKVCVKFLTYNWPNLGGELQHIAVRKNGGMIYRYLPVSVAEAEQLCKGISASPLANAVSVWNWIRPYK